jgi:small ligand-binding sensory domain FIST
MDTTANKVDQAIASRQGELRVLVEISGRVPINNMRKAARSLSRDHERTLDAMLATGLLMESEGWVFDPQACL